MPLHSFLDTADNAELILPRARRQAMRPLEGNAALNMQALDSAWRDVAQLSQSLETLLADCAEFSDLDDVRAQAEALQRCTDSYRRGVIAAKLLAGSGEAWLEEIRARLARAIDDYHRWDGEGGNYMSEKHRTGLEYPIDGLGEASSNVTNAIAQLQQVQQQLISH